MKDTEKEFLIALYQAPPGVMPRVICNQVGQYKQNWYYLDKWTRKGWYNYGVCADMGWLEEKGKAVARELLEEKSRG